MQVRETERAWVVPVYAWAWASESLAVWLFPWAHMTEEARASRVRVDVRALVSTLLFHQQCLGLWHVIRHNL